MREISPRTRAFDERWPMLVEIDSHGVLNELRQRRIRLGRTLFGTPVKFLGQTDGAAHLGDGTIA
jgi:hypothetical protein